MPGIYPKGGYDLAGFCVGIVEKSKILPRRGIKAGDILLGLPSSGLHSNGYSLIRNIIDEKGLSLSKKIYGNTSLGKLLIKPTKIYVNPILKALQSSVKIKAIAHITGGGIVNNLKRVMPNNLGFNIYKNNLAFFKKNNIFYWLKNECKVSEKELIKTFNCGWGMVLVVPRKEKEEVVNYFYKNKQNINQIGEVVASKNVAFN